MSQKIKPDRICVTYFFDKILLQRQRLSQKFSQYTRFVAVTCRRNMLLQLIARPVHTE